MRTFRIGANEKHIHHLVGVLARGALPDRFLAHAQSIGANRARNSAHTRSLEPKICKLNQLLPCCVFETPDKVSERAILPGKFLKVLLTSAKEALGPRFHSQLSHKLSALPIGYPVDKPFSLITCLTVGFNRMSRGLHIIQVRFRDFLGEGKPAGRPDRNVKIWKLPHRAILLIQV